MKQLRIEYIVLACKIKTYGVALLAVYLETNFVLVFEVAVPGSTAAPDVPKGILMYTVNSNMSHWSDHGKHPQDPIDVIAKNNTCHPIYGSKYRAPFEVGDKKVYTHGNGRLERRSSDTFSVLRISRKLYYSDRGDQESTRTSSSRLKVTSMSDGIIFNNTVLFSIVLFRTVF